MNKLNTLQKYFGYTSFRTGQEDLIDSIIEGNDALGIMPTGGGKSLCYQLPAVMQSGTAIVVSPLISLMKDQVDSLNEAGIPATFINSTLDNEEMLLRLDAMRYGDYKLVYVAPERLNSHMFTNRIAHMDISMIAIDEAHCISQWGHDFRPSYREIPRFLSLFAKRPPLAAFTATATKEVIVEIKDILQLQNATERVTGFDRPNLFYKVTAPSNKFKYLTTYLGNRPEGESGIIYCTTRKTVESLTKKLVGEGYAAVGYHGGMDSNVRKHVQEDFMFDRSQLIVATNAFGMGIDKPDVRSVVHYNMPKNMEAYYQEAGRAGRDGAPAECMLMYSPADIVSQKMLIDNDTQSDARKQLLNENLQYLINYCHSDDCLRHLITGYFDEPEDSENNAGAKPPCGHCGNCLDQSEKRDVTLESQKILSCIYRTNQAFGMNLIIQILRGSKEKRIMNMRLDNQSTYGLMKENNPGEIREIIMMLLASGYVRMTTDQFPILKLQNSAKSILKGQKNVFIKVDRLESSKASGKGSKRKAKRKAPSGSLEGLEYNQALFDTLAQIRKSISEEKGIPSYAVFHNSALYEMAALYPQTEDAFLDINGVGQKKFENYGKLFMETINSFCHENQVSNDQVEASRKKVDDLVDNLTEDEQKQFEVKSEALKESMDERCENTYKAYLEGMSLKEISTQRGFTSGTIIKHLERCQLKDMPVNWRKLIEEDKISEIQDVINDVGRDSLKAIKDALPNSVSYDDVRVVLEMLKQELSV